MAQTTKTPQLPLNKLEITGIKWAIARWKSKMPSAYAIVFTWCAVFAGVCTLYSVLYGTSVIPHSGYYAIAFQWSNMIIAVAATFGVHAKFQTNDPLLMGKEIISNINYAVKETHDAMPAELTPKSVVQSPVPIPHAMVYSDGTTLVHPEISNEASDKLNSNIPISVITKNTTEGKDETTAVNPFQVIYQSVS